MKEATMSDPNRPDRGAGDVKTTHDPDRGSTWSTIDGTADVDDLLDAEDLDDFLVEPTADPRTTLTDSAAEDGAT
jgi:hypothetical protein